MVPGVSIIKEKQQKSETSAKSAVLPTSLMSFLDIASHIKHVLAPQNDFGQI